jgi:hypothetical protein
MPRRGRQSLGDSVQELLQALVPQEEVEELRIPLVFLLGGKSRSAQHDKEAPAPAPRAPPAKRDRSEAHPPELDESQAQQPGLDESQAYRRHVSQAHPPEVDVSQLLFYFIIWVGLCTTPHLEI